MKVLVNIICRHEVSKEVLDRMIESCKSLNHEVVVHVCDYSLSKKIKDSFVESDSDVTVVKVTEMNYEDMRDHERNIKECNIAEDCDVIIDVESSLGLEPEFIDVLGLEHLEDKNYCSVYSDFYSQTKNGHKVYVHQKSFPLSSTSLPLLAFSSEDYLSNVTEENVKGFLLSSKLSKHTPLALCSVINA